MRTFYTLCAVAVLLCVLVAGAGAITVNVSVNKHNFTSNETIRSVVENMDDGVYYSQKTTFYQYMQPGVPSELGTSNVTWPFAHRENVFNMTNVGTVNNSVLIGHWWPPERGGSFEELWFDGASIDIVAPNGTVVEGTWNRSFRYDDEQIGTYMTHWYADTLPGVRVVESTFWINGTKLFGPSTFTENTSFWSRNPAYVTLDYYENNIHAASDWFTLDMDGPVYPAPTPADGEDAYPVGTGGSGGTGDGGTDAAPTTTGSADGGAPGGMTTAATTVAGTGGETPEGTDTPDDGTNASAATTTTPAGFPVAFAALGAVGIGALLLAGRARP